MLIKFRARAISGILVGIVSLSTAQINEQKPYLEKLIIKEIDNGLNITFNFSDVIETNDISGWIDRNKWLTLNLYNIDQPRKDFFSKFIIYPIQEIRQSKSMDAVQISTSYQNN